MPGRVHPEGEITLLPMDFFEFQQMRHQDPIILKKKRNSTLEIH
jgi:hypothetical protein